MSFFHNNALAGASGQTTGGDDGDAYQIERSLRLNDDDTPYLSRVFGSGNTRKWTWSGWIKRSQDEIIKTFFSSVTSSATSGRTDFQFANNNIGLQFNPTGSAWLESATTAKFRDISAWYHVVIAVDTAKEYNKDRVKTYVNGELVTSFQEYSTFTQNVELHVNSAVRHTIGRLESSPQNYLNSLIADVQFIDGLALHAAAFGSFDSNTGVWNPKAFVAPIPNTNKTWSAGTESGQALTNGGGGSQGWDKHFDGVLANPTMHTSSSATHYTYTNKLPAGIYRIHAALSSGSTVTHILTGDDDTEYTFGNGNFDGVIASGAANWSTEVRIPQEVKKVTLIDPSNGNGTSLRAIEVDGVILVDGQTDKTYEELKAVVYGNQGITHSNHLTGDLDSNHAVTNAFEGNTTNFVRTTSVDGASMVYKPPYNIPFTKFRISAALDGTSWGNVFKINDVDVTSSITNTGTTAAWLDLTSVVSSPFTKLEVISGGSNPRFWAIEINDIILEDGRDDRPGGVPFGANSFHLKFNDTSLNRYLGKDTFNGKIADATGGLPIYKTSDDYGDVKDGTAIRTDSDSSDLYLAITGDTLTDISNSINSSSTTKTVTASGSPVAAPSTTQSRFYGKSLRVQDTNNQNIVVTHHSELNLGSGNFTLEGWVYPENTGGMFGTSWAAVGSASDRQWLVQIGGANNYNARWMVRDTGGTQHYVDTAANTVPQNQWTHLAFVRNGNEMAVYCNGVKSVTDDYTGVTVNDPGTNWCFGANLDGYPSSELDGYYNDIRFYKKAKYTSNFTPPTRNDFTVNNLETRNTYWAGNWGKSSNFTVSGGSMIQYPDNGNIRRLFDGDTSTAIWNTSANSAYFWTPSPTRPTCTSTFRYYVASFANDAGHEIKVKFSDGTNDTNVFDSSPAAGWNTITHPGGAYDQIEYFKVTRGSGGYVDVSALELDGTILSETQEYRTDVLTDSPTNYGTDNGTGGEVRGNYATLNPYEPTYGTNVFSEGNLKCDPDTNWCASFGTMAPSTGKWYWEVLVGETNAYMGIQGGNQDNSNQNPQNNVANILYYSVNGKYKNGTTYTNYGASYAKDDYIGVALDLDSSPQTVTFYKNNSSQGAINLSVGTGIENNIIKPMFVQINDPYWVNFGQHAFKYTAPSGFKALCTQNLPDTFKDEAAAIVNNPSKYFDILKYTGTAAVNTIKGLNFQPELIWIKNRGDSSTSHSIYDTARGQGSNGYYRIEADTQDGQADESNLTAINSDGFTLTSAGGYTNSSGANFIAWCWDAGTAAATASTDGSITPSAQWVNATAGFSISKFTGTGADATIGHGLGAKPEFMMFKELSDPSNDSWAVYHKDLTNIEKWLALNTDDAEQTYADEWNETHPTNTVAHIGAGGRKNQNGNANIMYCWAPIAGYSAFGSYSDDIFIYTGFTPRFLLIKARSSAQDWWLMDSKRSPSNPVMHVLKTNHGGAEESDITIVDFLSNGFKIRTSSYEVGDDGNTYVYAAFAEHPFKTSRAR